MIAAARSRGLLTVGHIERYNPAIVELHRRLQNNELGRVFKMHARRLGPFPPRVRDVGVVIDLAPHDVDIMRWLSGAEVVRVYAETARQIHTEHEDLLSGGVALRRWADRRAGHQLAHADQDTRAYDHRREGDVPGGLLTQDLYFYENNYVKTDWDTISNISGVSEGDMIRLYIDRSEPLKIELQRFLQAAAGETVSIVTAEDALAALKIVHKIVEAGRTGAVINLAE